MKARLLLCFFICSLCAASQPFIDLVQANSQWLRTRYRNFDASHITQNHFLNLFIPKKLTGDKVAFVRMNAEMLGSLYSGDSLKLNHAVYQLALPLGLQFPLGEKGLSLTTMIMPRISTDLEDRLNHEDLQLGGVALLAWKKSEKFRLRAGLFYNRECFGNFFVPLLGVDWKISKRLQIYGLLPQYYRIDWELCRGIHTGLGMRFYGRSYRLADKYSDNYVWNQENQVKLFLDFYPKGYLVVYAELGRSLGYGPYEVFSKGPKTSPSFNNPLYSSLKDSYFLNLGAACRVFNR